MVNQQFELINHSVICQQATKKSQNFYFVFSYRNPETSFSIWLCELYKDEPSPEYAPKKNNVNKPRAASPPTVATIQRGTLPISLILIIFVKILNL